MMSRPALSAFALISLVFFSVADVRADAPPLPRPSAMPEVDQPPTRPPSRPASDEREASGPKPSPCGRMDILAERLPPIADAGACGITAPVRVRSIAGVALDPPPVVTCETAHAVHDWLDGSVKPAFESDGASLTGLDIAAAYVCRNVNYAEVGNVSEHAFGRALDISRFRRADGTVVSVLDDWSSPAYGDLLRAIHEDACGVFGTALGPDSNALHADHFHYDIAARRRPYCPSERADQPPN